MIKPEITKVSGFAELKQALNGLVRAAQRRIMQRALRRAAQPVLASARQKAPVLRLDPKRPSLALRRTPELLKKRLRIAGMKPKGDVFAVKVGVKPLTGGQIMKFKTGTKRKATDNPRDPFYARIVEKGKFGKSARPFVRPALHEQQGESLRILRQAIKEEMEVEARRQFRKVKP